MTTGPAISPGLARGLWSLMAHDIRDHAKDRHRSVDDTPFGGGAGMVLIVASPWLKKLTGEAS